VVPLCGDLYSTLDALKVADTALFLVSASQQNGIDAVGENVLTSSLAQGLPSTIVAVMDLESLPPKVMIRKTDWLIQTTGHCSEICKQGRL
jgi:pre-rRNA-processing protein TSR1